MKKKEDAFYIERAINGNTAAFTNLAEKYKSMAFTLAYRLSRNREDAEEIAQDAFLKAFRSLDRFKQDSSFSTWLYRIVYNTAVSRMRIKTAETVSIDTVDEAYVDIPETDERFGSFDADVRRKYIGLALDEIDSTDAFILTLYYLEELSVDEIVEATGMTKSNIKIRLYRGRKSLLASLTDKLKHEVKDLI